MYQFNLKKFYFLLICCSVASCFLFSQPSLREIKRHKIKSTTAISRIDSMDYSTKTVYNIYGHDSLIFYNGELTFYSKAEADILGRIKQLIFFNGRNNAVEEVHQFIYSKDGSYKIEVIAHGAGLIYTETYNDNHQLLKSFSSDDEEIIYEYNNEGNLKKIFQKIGKEKKELVSLTLFNDKGLKSQTETFGVESSIIFYEHDSIGLVTKIRLKPKGLPGNVENEIVYIYEF